MKIVDLSGYSYSGKSAYYDLFSSLSSVKSFGIESEFDLIRVQDGIYDLFQTLTDDNWSLIRSSHAIHVFKNLVLNLAGKRSLITRLNNLGLYYDDLFPGFFHKSCSFIDKLILSSYNAYWPFPYYTSQKSTFLSKVLSKTRSKSSPIYLSRFRENDLILLIQEYLSSLFHAFENSQYDLCILNNALETSCPQSCLRFLPNAYSIVIDRDPRDIYTSAYLSYKKGATQATVVIGSNVSQFIDRFCIQRQNTQIHHSNVLRLKYEDLMLNFSETTSLLAQFLGLPCFYFDSASFLPSQDNIKSWIQFPDDDCLQRSIGSIEYHLPGYCFL